MTEGQERKALRAFWKNLQGNANWYGRPCICGYPVRVGEGVVVRNDITLHKTPCYELQWSPLQIDRTKSTRGRTRSPEEIFAMLPKFTMPLGDLKEYVVETLEGRPDRARPRPQKSAPKPEGLAPLAECSACREPLGSLTDMAVFRVPRFSGEYPPRHVFRHAGCCSGHICVDLGTLLVDPCATRSDLIAQMTKLASPWTEADERFFQIARDVAGTAAETREQRTITISRALTTFSQPEASMQRYVRFYRDGDSVAVSTNVTDEREFQMLAPSALADFLDNVPTKKELTLLIAASTPLIVDLSCKLRGYKAPLVEEQRVLTAGKIPPRESLLVASSEEERPGELADAERQSVGAP